MTRKQIHTIILQEEKIEELTKRNKELEAGYRSICIENDKLQKIIKKKERSENELNKVNI